MSGGASSWGIRSLADNFLRYFQPGLPVYLRKQNQTNSPDDYSALGFQPTVSGGPTGFYDTLIDPPADVTDVSLHNIGLFGGKLMFGAKIFIISHTFVLNQMNQFGYTDPYQVFRNDTVVGFYYDQRLFSIESLTHEDVGGIPTLWKVVCNLQEQIVAPSQ